MLKIKSLFLLIILFSTSSFAVTNPVTEGYVDVKNGKIYYQTYGKGSPIILINGGPGFDHEYLLPQTLDLMKDHTLIYYDQRGTGRSLETPIDDTTININQYVEDLDDVRKKLGFEKVTILGHSWGGRLALEYAIKHQDHIDNLILMGSTPANSKGFKAFLDEVAIRLKPVKAQLLAMEKSKEYKEGTPKMVADYYRLIFSTYLYKRSDGNKISLKFTTPYALNMPKIMGLMHKVLNEFDLSSDLKNIKFPTLIIHGDHDPIPLWTAQEIQTLIPNSKLEIMKNIGHFPPVENQAEFIRVIEDFVQPQTQKTTPTGNYTPQANQ
jgi:proline iminopeptidase